MPNTMGGFGAPRYLKQEAELNHSYGFGGYGGAAYGQSESEVGDGGQQYYADINSNVTKP